MSASKYKLSAILFLILAQFSISMCSKDLTIKEPEIINGSLDLTEWDFSKASVVSIDGHWDFYWNKFISSKEILEYNTKPDYSLKIPGNWKGKIINKEVLDGDGYCTLHLQIKLPKTNIPFGIRIPAIGTATKIWANDKLIFEAGVLGKSKEEMTAFLLPEIVSIGILNTNELHLIIQISNFMDRTGGVWGNITFGDIESLYKKKIVIVSAEMLILGSLFIISFYHLGLFMIRTKERSALFFGLFCLDFGLRTLVTEHRLLISAFPNLPFDYTFRLEYITGYLAFPLFANFISELFKNEMSKTYIRLVWITAILLCSTVLFLDHFVYTQFLILFELLLCLSIPYLIYVNIRGIIKKYQGSITSFVGLVILAFGSVIDILHNEHITFMYYLMPFAIFGFLFFQSFSLSMKFSKAYSDSENFAVELLEKGQSLMKINKELNDLKTDLELKVEERTESLKVAYQNSNLESQKIYELEKEIAVQKERQKIFLDIHDHTGSNLLDLKNLLRLFINKEEFSNEYREKIIFTAQRIEDNLKMRIHSIEDLEILHNDPLNGIRLLTLRRYSFYNRDLHFFLEEELYNINPKQFSTKLIETLYTISQENATNDLKYGEGISNWRFFKLKNKICLEIKSQSNYSNEMIGFGSGRRNIDQRLKEINGFVIYCDVIDSFHAMYYFPIIEIS